MNVTDNASLKRWVASGVRHEVLLRALPSLRHDMAAPVSILRMTTLLLKRQLAAMPVDVSACAQRVTVLDNQMSELIDGIRLLRGWETSAEPGVETTRDAITRPALVAKCLSLLRPVFDLRGVTIDVDPSLEACAEPAAETAWPNGFALRYLLLGSLCYLHDAHADLGAVRIAPDGVGGLQLRPQPQAADAGPSLADLVPSDGRLEIDAAAFQCMVDELGYRVDITPDGVRLCLTSV